MNKAKQFLMNKRVGKNGKLKRSRARKMLEEGGAFVGGLKGLGGLGRYAGTKIADLIGAGAYRVSTGRPKRRALRRNVNRAVQLPVKTGPLDKIFTIQHREYIQDVSTSTAFSSLTFNLNPGLSSTFPWLSTLAPCFQKYKFRQCAFQLVSNSAFAVSSTNTALGCWGAVTQIDASDPPLATKQQAENYQGCESCVPARSLLHQVECAKKDSAYKWYFVRTGALNESQDIKTYDEGVFNYFSQGAQAASVAGELWVTYTVDFMIPALPVGGLVAYTDEILGGSANTANPLGTTATYNPNNNLGITISPTVINIPATAPQGMYNLIVNYTYASPQTLPTLTTTADGVVMVDTGDNVFFGQSQSFIVAPATGTIAASRTVIHAFRKIQQSAGSITVACTHPASATMEIVVTLMNPNMAVPGPPALLLDEAMFLKQLLQEHRIRQQKAKLTMDRSDCGRSTSVYDDNDSEASRSEIIERKQERFPRRL